MRNRLAPTLLAAVLATTGLAACGDDDDADASASGSGSGSASSSGPTSAPAADEAPPGGGGDVALAETDLGEVLVDAEGMTLYLFTSDTDGTSTCDDDCADAWPALTTDGEPAAGEGVDAALLGTTERDDGTSQVTYAGQPLYLYAADQAPGDTLGQGVGDVWYAVDATGDAVSS